MTHEPDTQHIDALAAIIREVDGGHRLGADALAAAILSHPSSRWGPAPAPAPAVFPEISDGLMLMLILDIADQLATSTESALYGRSFDPVPRIRARLLEILQLAAEDAAKGGALPVAAMGKSFSRSPQPKAIATASVAVVVVLG